MMIGFVIKSSFFTCILASVYFFVKSVESGKWDTATACVSLIIAIISAWIAWEAFRRQAESENPQLVLSVDMYSRYSILMLVLQNHGKKPAFKIRISWDKPFFDNEGNAVKFESQFKGEKDLIDIPVLVGSERISKFICGVQPFFQKYEHDDLTFSGTIDYSLSTNGLFTRSEKFIFSLNSYRDTILNENEDPKTHHELQKIPSILTEIKKELSGINKKMAPGN